MLSPLETSKSHLDVAPSPGAWRSHLTTPQPRLELQHQPQKHFTPAPPPCSNSQPSTFGETQICSLHPSSLRRGDPGMVL